jgi:hypothetical protein
VCEVSRLVIHMSARARKAVKRLLNTYEVGLCGLVELRFGSSSDLGVCWPSVSCQARADDRQGSRGMDVPGDRVAESNAEASMICAIRDE